MPRLESFFSILPSYSFQLTRNEKLLFVVKILRQLLNKVTVLFLPIFLFLIATDLPWMNTWQLSGMQKGIVVIAAFFCIQRFVTFVTAIPLSKLMLKSGQETSLIFSYLLRTIMFAALFFARLFPELLILAAVLEGLQANFFWNSFIVIAAKRGFGKRHLKSATVFNFFLQILLALSPAFSGYIAYMYGLETVFLVGIVLSLVSAMIVMMTSLRFPQDSASWPEFVGYCKKNVFIKSVGSLGGTYINDAVLFLWPLYVYLVLGTVERVGFLFSISLFITLMMTYFVAEYVSHIFFSKKSVFMSGVAVIGMWLVRVTTVSAWGMIFIDVLDRIFSGVYWTNYDIALFKQTKGNKVFSYFVYREMVVSLIGMLFWITCAILFLLTSPWSVIFIFAGFGVSLSMLVRTTPHEKQISTAIDL